MPTLDSRFMPGRLFIGGLPSEGDAVDIIARIARLPATRVLGSEVVVDAVSREFKGFAYVDLAAAAAETEASAQAALLKQPARRRNRDESDAPADFLTPVISQLHGLAWKGAKLRIERARENFTSKLARQRAADEEEAAAAAARAREAAAFISNLSPPVQMGTVRLRRRKTEPLLAVPLKPPALPAAAPPPAGRRTAPLRWELPPEPHEGEAVRAARINWTPPERSSSYIRGSVAALAPLRGWKEVAAAASAGASACWEGLEAPFAGNTGQARRGSDGGDDDSDESASTGSTGWGSGSDAVRADLEGESGSGEEEGAQHLQQQPPQDAEMSGGVSDSRNGLAQAASTGMAQATPAPVPVPALPATSGSWADAFAGAMAEPHPGSVGMSLSPDSPLEQQQQQQQQQQPAAVEGPRAATTSSKRETGSSVAMARRATAAGSGDSDSDSSGPGLDDAAIRAAMLTLAPQVVPSGLLLRNSKKARKNLLMGGWVASAASIPATNESEGAGKLEHETSPAFLALAPAPVPKLRMKPRHRDVQRPQEEKAVTAKEGAAATSGPRNSSATDTAAPAAAPPSANIATGIALEGGAGAPGTGTPAGSDASEAAAAAARALREERLATIARLAKLVGDDNLVAAAAAAATAASVTAARSPTVSSAPLKSSGARSETVDNAPVAAGSDHAESRAEKQPPRTEKKRLRQEQLISSMHAAMAAASAQGGHASGVREAGTSAAGDAIQAAQAAVRSAVSNAESSTSSAEPPQKDLVKRSQKRKRETAESAVSAFFQPQADPAAAIDVSCRNDEAGAFSAPQAGHAAHALPAVPAPATFEVRLPWRTLLYGAGAAEAAAAAASARDAEAKAKHLVPFPLAHAATAFAPGGGRKGKKHGAPAASAHVGPQAEATVSVSHMLAPFGGVKPVFRDASFRISDMFSDVAAGDGAKGSALARGDSSAAAAAAAASFSFGFDVAGDAAAKKQHSAASENPSAGGSTGARAVNTTWTEDGVSRANAPPRPTARLPEVRRHGAPQMQQQQQQQRAPFHRAPRHPASVPPPPAVNPFAAAFRFASPHAAPSDAREDHISVSRRHDRLKDDYRLKSKHAAASAAMHHGPQKGRK